MSEVRSMVPRVGAALAFATSCTCALAQDETPAPPSAPFQAADGRREALPSAESNPWRAEITAWLWLPAVSGDVGVRGRTANVDASFTDIVSDSDSIFAGGGRAEVGYGRFAAFVDGFYADLGANDVSGPLNRADIDATFEEGVLDFGAMFRLGQWGPSGEASKDLRPITLDLYAGGRWTDITLELDPAHVRTRSRHESWVDPIVGAKFVLPFAEQWRFSVNGDIGGFGVESDLTWSATALLGYDFHIGKLPATVFAGYRAIDWDFDTGSGANEFTWQVIEHGPLMGLSVRF